MKRLILLMMLLTISVAAMAERSGWLHARRSFFREESVKPERSEAMRQALLIVHFGTSYDETRSQTIDAINALARESFPDYEVREAWTSRMIVGKLKARGVEKLLPVEALMRLRADGYTRVIVQATTLLEGAEMASLRADVASLAPFFDEILVGQPLLYSVDDCSKVADILLARHLLKADARKREHVVFVGHGIYAPANSTYSQMEHLMQHKAGDLFHVATIEGYPTLETLIDDLKAAKARKVTLVPFLLVAGDHATNDISVEWKEALEAEGIEVEVVLEGLGQVPEIRNLYIDKVNKK